jgi:hypothetical protein
MAAPPLVYVDTNVFIAAYEASGDSVTKPSRY